MNRFLSLAAAAEIFGYGSATALRKAFERSRLPAKYLVRIGARCLRVDGPGLEAWLLDQQAYPSIQPKQEIQDGH